MRCTTLRMWASAIRTWDFLGVNLKFLLDLFCCHVKSIQTILQTTDVFAGRCLKSEEGRTHPGFIFPLLLLLLVVWDHQA